MDGLVDRCPVPREQQPIQEFQALKTSGFFAWATVPWATFISKLGWLWVGSWIVTGPVVAASFSPQRYPVQFVLLAAAGSTLLPTLVLVRLYLGWVYIRGRLFSETVFYEESGWYDGQTWIKPTELLNRDRLIVNYEIKPMLQRLHLTFCVLVVLLLGGGVFWQFL